jgi:hypothetical protein
MLQAQAPPPAGALVYLGAGAQQAPAPQAAGLPFGLQQGLPQYAPQYAAQQQYPLMADPQQGAVLYPAPGAPLPGGLPPQPGPGGGGPPMFYGP